MKKKILFTSLLAVATVLFGTSGCKQYLTPSELAQYNAVSTELSKPVNLKASKGNSRLISLEWDPVLNASQYEIYAADEPTAPFEKINETKKGEHNIDISSDSGIYKYFKVVAVDAKEKKSDFSGFVVGSTLSVPVISQIKALDDGNTVNLKWWMNNSDREFQDDIVFTVNVYEDSQAKEPFLHLSNISGDKRSQNISGLKGATTYYFELIAENSAFEKAVETSSKESKETAHCLIPEAVADMEATKGSSQDLVRVSFTLPPCVDVKTTSTDIYESHSVYFELYRSEKDMNEYTRLAVIKSRDSSNPKNSVLFAQKAEGSIAYYFDSRALVTNDSSLSVTECTEDLALINDNYPEYIAGYKIEFFDDSAERGIRYDYKIQSYVDDISKTVSSDESVAYASGWKLAPYSLSQNTKVLYKENSEEDISQIFIQLKFEFDSMDQEYNYILVSKRFDIETNEIIGDELRIPIAFADINLKPIEFSGDKLFNESGYYQYSIEILDLNDILIARANLSERILVNEKDSVRINYFEVIDGFSDMYILKWDYNPNYTYSISWEDVKASSLEEMDDDDTIIITSENISITDEVIPAIDPESNVQIATFVHKDIPSGTNRKYILTASNGIKKEEPRSGNLTIGQPMPVFNEYAYDSVKVNWNKVQCATKYILTAKFQGSDDVIATHEFNDSYFESSSCSYVFEDNKDESGNVISKWIDYTNAEVSGKKIIVEISAINDSVNEKWSDHNSVNSAVNTYTMGPASLGVATSGIFAKDSMGIKWNKMEGANYYLIQRLNYSDTSCNVIGSYDTYIYSVNEGTLSVNGDSVNARQANVRLNGSIYEFTDYYVEPEGNTDIYGTHQSYIPFGLPFGYIVIPMISDTDFAISEEANEEKVILGAVNYTNLSETVNSTWGMGLNVHAEKACKDKMEVLTWDAPYVTGNEAYVYTRPAGSNSTWTLIGNTTNKTINYEADKYDPYEYAVVYKNSSSTTMLPSYINYLARTLDSDTPIDAETGKPCEQLNKGYLLNIRYSAAYNGNKNDDGTYAKDDHYYAEKITWTPWDYTKKALGPDKMEFLTFNANLKKGWQTVASTDSTTEPDSLQFSTSLEDTTVGRDGNGVELVPTSIKNGGTNTNGALKILRDAKHYYAVRLTRGTNVATIGSDYSTYAYRQITGEELIKVTMLNVANMIVSEGPEIYTIAETASGFAGGGEVVKWNSGSSFGWSKKWAADGKGAFRWYILNHVQSYSSMPGGKAVDSFISMTDKNENKAIRGFHDGNNGGCKLRTLSNGSKDYGTLIEIQVKPSSDYSDLTLDTYTGTVGFTCTDNTFKATASTGSGDYSSGEKSGDEVKYWSPIRIGNVNTYFGGSDDNAVKYGWWPAE